MVKRYVHHLCIQTNDYSSSLNFYTNALGFKLVQESPNFHGRQYNTWLQLDDFLIELQTGKADQTLDTPNPDSEGLVHFCIWVDDLENEVKRLQQQNINFLEKNGKKIYFVENGALCKIKAPEGTIIELRNNKGI